MFTELSTALSGASATQVCAALAYLKQADICFMNCEMPLTRRGYQIEKTVNLRSDPGVAQDLATLGIHVVSLANNHMMDYGYEGLDDTLAFIDRAGIARVGAGMNIEEALRPHYRTMKGQRFAFISVATTLPPGFAASSGRPGIAPIHVAFSFDIDTNLMAEQPGTAPVVRTVASPQDVDRVTAVIAAARCEADHVIVSVHWGITRRRVTPCQGMIAEYQRPLGRAFIDAGADIVLGNHSHNLHGIEVHRGKPIFYSLGNFIFQRPHDYMEPESTLVLADFVGPSLQIRLVPVLLNPSGFPEMPNAAERNRIIAVLKERSAPFGTEVTVDGQRRRHQSRRKDRIWRCIDRHQPDPSSECSVGKDCCRRSSRGRSVVMDETPKDLPGPQRLNRRRMLMLTAGLASTSVASLLAACGGTSPPAATPTAPMPTASAASSVPSQPTNSATSATTAKKGGMLHVVFAEEPVNLHPQIQSGTEGWYVEKQIYDSMVNIDGNGKIVPGLATDLPEQPDDRTYIFHLRQNVTFHNGKPFTADDVVWTFDRLVGKFSNLQSTQADRFKSHLAQVDKLDTYTVKITLSQPWTDFLSLMASDKYMSITQRDAEEANPKEYGQSVTVGTGPFMFKEWVKGDHLTLVRNDKYWGTPAYPDQIVYKAIPEDATRMSALGAGETDILFDPALKDVKQYGGNAKFRVQAVDGGNMKLLAFNTSRAPFTDRRVRQAILYALDRQEIVDSIYYSYAAVGQDLLPPWNPAHDPVKTYYPYDLEQAKKLLSDAGYGQSKPLEFEIVTTAVTEFTDLATLIQAQLQRVGVKVTVTALDKSAYYTKTFPQQGKANSNYQASIYRLKYGFVTEDYTYRTYHPSSTINIAGYNQPGGAQNPEVLTLLDHAGTITDPRQQKETYGKLSDLINEDAPMFCLAWQKTVSIIRAPVQNFTTLVLDVMPLKDVWLAQ